MTPEQVQTIRAVAKAGNYTLGVAAQRIIDLCDEWDRQHKLIEDMARMQKRPDYYPALPLPMPEVAAAVEEPDFGPPNF